MATNENVKKCMVIVIGTALVLLFFGFLDMFKNKPTGNQSSKVDVISQQLRGIGLFLLALVVLSLGSALCYEGFHESYKPSNAWNF
jgi:purine-cytosine permease-like protein